MPPSTLLLLLSLSLSFPVVQLITNFEFAGVITCTLKRNFTYMLQVIEEDTGPGTDDVISESVLRMNMTSPVSYHIKAQDKGDGPWNNYYEIAFLINHDCSMEDNPRHMVLKHKVLDFWIFDGTHKHNVSLDITAKGYFAFLPWPKESAGPAEQH